MRLRSLVNREGLAIVRGRLLTKGLREALRVLYREVGIWLVHRRGLRAARRLSSPRDLKLHLGSGRHRLEGWVNVDISGDANLTLDLREPWPFPDGCASRVFAEHFLEHFEYPEEATHILREAHRVLRPGGEIRLGVPDTAWPLTSYAEGADAEYFRLAKRLWHPSHVQTALEHINWHFREYRGDHKYAYDEETLSKVLRECGFVDISSVPFDSSTDSEKRRIGTLYVVGRKGSKHSSGLSRRNVPDGSHRPILPKSPSPSDGSSRRV